MSQPQPKHDERADFLAWETTQVERWERIAGRIKMMAGGSATHNLIAGNVFAALYSALGDGPCVAFQQNQKLAATENEDIVYPDVVVTCQPFDGRAQTLTSATLVVEVLSPSTRQDDLDAKRAGYQQIADLRHYLVLETNSPVALLYSRSGVEAPWSYRRITGLGATIELVALGVVLPLAVLYRRTAIGLEA